MLNNWRGSENLMCFFADLDDSRPKPSESSRRALRAYIDRRRIHGNQAPVGPQPPNLPRVCYTDDS